MWPTQKQIESSWVYSALDAIRKPESPYAYKLRESRFKDISDRELIEIINIEYNANKVRGKMPTIQEAIKHPAFKTLPPEEQKKVFSRLSPEYNKLPPEEQDKVIKYFSTFKNLRNVFDIAEAKLEQEKKAADNLPEGFILENKPPDILIAQLEGELITPGEKLAQQCEEKLKEVNLRYQKEIETLGINRLKIVGIAFMAWIIPSGIVYLLCLAVVWIYKGFKAEKT